MNLKKNICHYNIPIKKKSVNIQFIVSGWIEYEESMLHGKELIMSIQFDEDSTFGITNKEIGDDYEDLLRFKH